MTVGVKTPITLNLDTLYSDITTSRDEIAGTYNCLISNYDNSSLENRCMEELKDLTKDIFSKAIQSYDKVTSSTQDKTNPSLLNKRIQVLKACKKNLKAALAGLDKAQEAIESHSKNASIFIQIFRSIFRLGPSQFELTITEQTKRLETMLKKLDKEIGA